MSYISIDIEADGPCPGEYSMIAFGACLVENPNIGCHFVLKPISNKWVSKALQISGFTREECEKFNDPEVVMTTFAEWLKLNCKNQPIFVSDNNGFDWQFINYYFWRFLDKNPFGHSSMNLGSLYKGMVKNTFKNFKHLRKTKHDHNPLHDAQGNAEALQEMKRLGLLIEL